MQKQLNHEQISFEKRIFPITLVCDSIYFQDNIGSVFRIAEAFGVEKILFLGNPVQFNYRKINRTSRNTHKLIPHQIFEKQEELITHLQQKKLYCIALEITDKSKNIQEIQLPKKQNIALIIGSEISGTSPEFLNIADQTVHITMYGLNSSMNVVQATGIALYEITNQLIISS